MGMNRRKTAAFFAALALVFVFTGVRMITAHTKAYAEGGASGGEVVLELHSRRVLHAMEADQVMPMASTTKILTAIIIIEDCPLEDLVTVPKSCTGTEGSSIYLVAGEKITVKNLLYGLMLRSGNDCAETLAVYHSGSIEKFAACMNARAVGMGAVASHFANPHGLPDDEHYTTARDLAMIACHAMENEVFREIVSCQSVVIPDGGCGYARTLVNKNKMLYQYEGANGIKTGYTKAAGRCLVSAAERNGMQLICVVLDCPMMYERSGELLDAVFAAFAYQCIYKAEEHRYTVATDVPGKSCTGACMRDFYFPLTKEEMAEVRLEKCFVEPHLPVKEGEELGILRIYLKNQLLFSQKIYSINSVKKSWADILAEIARKYCRIEGTCVSINISPNAASEAGAPATG